MVFSPNILAIVGVTVLHFVIGMLWYSPLVFGKLWMRSLGKTKKDMKKSGPAMIIHVVASLILVAVLAYFVSLGQATTAVDGATIGFWIWLGFIATTSLATYMFENRNMNLYYIYMFYQLIALVFGGAILAVWV